MMLRTLWHSFANVKANRWRAISAHSIERWARRFNKAVTMKVLMEIYALYYMKYG